MMILYVSDSPISLEIGNASRIFNISQAFCRRGFNVLVIPSTVGLPKFLSGRGRIPTHLRRVYLFFSMMCWLLREKIDCIYTIEFYLGLEAVILARFFKIRTIYDFGGFVYQEEIHRGHRFKPLLTRLLERSCLKRSDILVTQTVHNKEALLSFRKKVFVIENGVDLDLFKELTDQRCEQKDVPPFIIRPIVGFIGNWENWMNIEDLLQVPDCLKEVTIVVVGQGKKLGEYRKKYPKVIFTGRLPHRKAMRLLLDFDICVCPYSANVIMKHKQAMKTKEYLAAGKPIVVSRVEGRESFFKEGEHCLFYEPGASQDLAQKIQNLWDNMELRERMARNNRELAREFSWDNTLARSGLVEALGRCVE